MTQEERDKQRDAIARIIDPVSWDNLDYYIENKPPGVPTDINILRRDLLGSSIKKANKILDQIVPDGWDVIPLEPTPEMLAAWYRTKNTGTTVVGETSEDKSDYAAYRALIAAAHPLPDKE